MLDITFIRENKDIVEKSIKDRRSGDVDIDLLLETHTSLLKTRKELDEIRRKQNEAASERDVESGRILKEQMRDIQEKERELAHVFRTLLASVPNVPSPDTPVGKDENENVVIRMVGEKTVFSFTPKDHEALGKALDIIDSERAARVAGARFTYIKGSAAMIQVALIQFVFSSLTNKKVIEEIVGGMGSPVSTNPFVPMFPPTMIKPDVYFATARLEPKEDRFFLPKDNLYLTGSAEHTLCSMFLNETLSEERAPYRFIGYSTAYRREAGSYGKDTRGILRQHQFDKLEMESFTVPEDSRLEHEFFVAVQEYLVKALGIPYQVVSVCTGDMGDPNQKQTDIEMWMPGQNTYRETHSADFIGSYQARRLGTRIQRKDGKKEVAHTNDATAFAIGRTLIAILENYQQEDGSVKIPKVLQESVGAESIRSNE